MYYLCVYVGILCWRKLFRVQCKHVKFTYTNGIAGNSNTRTEDFKLKIIDPVKFEFSNCFKRLLIGFYLDAIICIIAK